MFGSLWVPDELLAGEYALDLLGGYFRRDEDGYVYSGAVFDTYPADPASGTAAPGNTTNVVTDSDLVALSLLGIRVTGYEALIITQYRVQEIENLLGSISARAHIEEEASAVLLARGGPAWRLWELLYEIKDRTRENPVRRRGRGQAARAEAPGPDSHRRQPDRWRVQAEST